MKSRLKGNYNKIIEETAENPPEFKRRLGMIITCIRF
jgi:hypothetical protein